MSDSPARRYRLYVIELGKHPGSAERPTVYVGSTSLSRRQRWRQHRAGGFTASRRVTRYGTRRLTELARGTGTYLTRTAAEAAEHRLQLDLKGRAGTAFSAAPAGRCRRVRAARTDHRLHVGPRRARRYFTFVVGD